MPPGTAWPAWRVRPWRLWAAPTVPLAAWLIPWLPPGPESAARARPNSSRLTTAIVAPVAPANARYRRNSRRLIRFNMGILR